MGDADPIVAAVALIIYLELRAAMARHGIAPRRSSDPPNGRET